MNGGRTKTSLRPEARSHMAQPSRLVTRHANYKARSITFSDGHRETSRHKVLKSNKGWVNRQHNED